MLGQATCLSHSSAWVSSCSCRSFQVAFAHPLSSFSWSTCICSLPGAGTFPCTTTWSLCNWAMLLLCMHGSWANMQRSLLSPWASLSIVSYWILCLVAPGTSVVSTEFHVYFFSSSPPAFCRCRWLRALPPACRAETSPATRRLQVPAHTACNRAAFRRLLRGGRPPPRRAAAAVPVNRVTACRAGWQTRQHSAISTYAKPVSAGGWVAPGKHTGETPTWCDIPAPGARNTPRLRRAVLVLGSFSPAALLHFWISGYLIAGSRSFLCYRLRFHLEGGAPGYSVLCAATCLCLKRRGIGALRYRARRERALSGLALRMICVLITSFSTMAEKRAFCCNAVRLPLFTTCCGDVLPLFIWVWRMLLGATGCLLTISWSLLYMCWRALGLGVGLCFWRRSPFLLFVCFLLSCLYSSGWGDSTFSI